MTQLPAMQTKRQAQGRPLQASTHSRTIHQQKERAQLRHGHQSTGEKRPAEMDRKPQAGQEAQTKPDIDLLVAKSPSMPSRTGHSQQPLKQDGLLGQRLVTQSLPSLTNSTKQLPKPIVTISLSNKEVEQIARQPELVTQMVAPKSFK